MKLILNVWRQKGPSEPGRLVRYELDGVDARGSLLDALDLLNDRLVAKGDLPVAFESDCREGICGACGVVVIGQPHGGGHATTCEFMLRDVPDGAELTLEPFRVGPFHIVRDLIVDRSALDRVVQAGGFITVRTGSAPEANTVAVPKEDAERALDAAACIGCGACVAACPNGSASLFAGAKLAHLGRLPHGQPERRRRALAMTRALDDEGFGGCSLHGECERACPKSIGIDVIARMNHDVLTALAFAAPKKRR